MGCDVVENAYGLEIPQTLVEACNPKRTALFVYDMQVRIIRQINNSSRIVAQVKLVLDAARAAGLRVFFHAAHVIAEGSGRRFPTAHDDGVAKGENGSRGKPLVSA